MDEIEKIFKCPYCLEKISMLIDTSIEDEQTYIEDCEVCCNPIQLSFTCINSKIKNFAVNKAYG